MAESPEHNPSGSEVPESGAASRFWHQYGATRPPTRQGRRNGGGRGEAGGPEGRPDGEHECLEWCPICRGADVVRATTPPELREQWQTVQRDALVIVRELIDAYLERIGEVRGRRAARPVEDIPIE